MIKKKYKKDRNIVIVLFLIVINNVFGQDCSVDKVLHEIKLTNFENSIAMLKHKEICNQNGEQLYLDDYFILEYFLSSKKQTLGFKKFSDFANLYIKKSTESNYVKNSSKGLFFYLSNDIKSLDDLFAKTWGRDSVLISSLIKSIKFEKKLHHINEKKYFEILDSLLLKGDFNKNFILYQIPPFEFYTLLKIGTDLGYKRNIIKSVIDKYEIHLDIKRNLSDILYGPSNWRKDTYFIFWFVDIEYFNFSPPFIYNEKIWNQKKDIVPKDINNNQEVKGKDKSW